MEYLLWVKRCIYLNDDTNTRLMSLYRVIFAASMVLACLAGTVLAIEVEPSWTNRFNELQHEILEKVHTPRVGDTVTIVPRIGKVLSGIVNGIGPEVIIVDGVTYKPENLTRESCDQIFTLQYAKKVALQKIQEEMIGVASPTDAIMKSATKSIPGQKGDSTLLVSADNKRISGNSSNITREVNHPPPNAVNAKPIVIKGAEGPPAQFWLAVVLACASFVLLVAVVFALRKREPDNKKSGVCAPLGVVPGPRGKVEFDRTVLNHVHSREFRRVSLTGAYQTAPYIRSLPPVRQPARESRKRQRDLEREAKETAKLSSMVQARIEVETYENAVDVLLSIHKEASDPFDWHAVLVALPPVPPRKCVHNELKARQRNAIGSSSDNVESEIDRAKMQDADEYQAALKLYSETYSEWEKMRRLAQRVLCGESGAYLAAIEGISPFAELDGIGSSLHFRVHGRRVVEIILSTNGRQAIPAEQKTLTANGKLSVKPLPKARFVEIYQDYVCGCVLRVARELFSLLPVETLLISATVESPDPATGKMLERTFLSVVISSNTLKTLNFEELDPSDCIMSLPHRGDLKHSKKTGEFEFVSPLSIADIDAQCAPVDESFDAALGALKKMRESMALQSSLLRTRSVEDAPTNGEIL